MLSEVYALSFSLSVAISGCFFTNCWSDHCRTQ